MDNSFILEDLIELLENKDGSFYVFWRRMFTMRCAVCPSQRGGILPVFHCPAYSRCKAGWMFIGSVPISSLVPIVHVSGRSVLFRSVRHGIDMTVVSSVMPPLSVMTARACCTR